MATFRIAGVAVIPPVLPLDIGQFDISKAKRNTRGYMSMQIIRKGVRRIEAKWKRLKDSDLQHILNVIDANKPFFTLEYPDVGGQQTKTVYSGDARYSLYKIENGERVWDEITIPFIEQ